jgi:hypothetical protein
VAGSAGRSSDPLVGELRTASVELTDQGIRLVRGGETHRRLEARPQAVAATARFVLEFAGVYPIFSSVLVVVRSGRFLCER